MMIPVVDMGRFESGSLAVKAQIAQQIDQAAEKILQLIENTPLYYQDVAGKLAEYDFQTVARALGKLHADGKLWQDPRGRLCLKDSAFAAKPPVRS